MGREGVGSVEGGRGTGLSALTGVTTVQLLKDRLRGTFRLGKARGIDFKSDLGKTKERPSSSRLYEKLRGANALTPVFATRTLTFRSKA
jgi:hypothetical protein